MNETKQENCLYIYSILNTAIEQNLGPIGINDNPVYTIVFRDIAAAVHFSESKPEPAKDEQQAKEWIFSHNYVIDKMTEKFNTVLPFSFGCVALGDSETIRSWLQKNYRVFKSELERLNDTAEYLVQIFYDPKVLTEKVLKDSSELQEMNAKIDGMSKGKSYILKKQFDVRLDQAIIKELSRLGTEFGKAINENVKETIHEEKRFHVPEKYKGKKSVITLSCLVSNENVENLGHILKQINQREGFAVRFTGPWAPFSFVDLNRDFQT
ncbi:MAG: GvpL/GvpF family gas vesicle protein [Methanosarcina sp.]|nr:GvpL/GvpF family gas vesicle protein [Methanosarcina sp.]MDD3872769.1 GvpL/GvpF family gas vesicle protein [Methanosarcina sp.]MDD4522546.1 GvpL/GvpF family gas vesicle protein [Methanosarcina sp.]